MSSKLNRSAVLLSGIVLGGGLLLLLDVNTPRGVADCMLYVAIILPTLWNPHRWITLVAGLVATAFTVLGYFYSPTSTDINIPVLNRVFSLITIWTAVILIKWHKEEMGRARFYRDRWNSFFQHVDQGILLINKGRCR